MGYLRAAMIAATAFVCAGRADANEKPVIAPVPAWVKPVAAAKAPVQPDDAPVRFLSSSQQVALERGRQTIYSDVALKIQTPQGLAAGNISFPWRPETDDLIVHKLLIRRGDRVIDVLASGQTFTVMRREQNLESATLDGILTANIQPEGLQVGDILEFAVSVSSSDPTMRGHVEQFAAMWNDVPVGVVHLRMRWPATLPIRLRQSGDLPPLKQVKSGGAMEAELRAENVAPMIVPKGAPARYQIGRVVEATDFASWAELGALMAPLYAKAAVLPATGPLRDEFSRIAALSTDPKRRAEAALALVQDRIRYVALARGTGGYVPTDAETSWSRRYGDCKAKTALLLALLRNLGIEAEPVAVNSVSGDGIEGRLPMIGLFNHVLVRATIGGRSYWLDGTRTGDTDIDRLTIPAFGWGLPLIETGAALVRMMPEPLKQPGFDASLHIDARAGLRVPAPSRGEVVLRGDDAVATNLALSNMAGDARDRALRDYWRKRYDFIEATTVTARFDAQTGEMRLAMAGSAKMDWSSGSYETDGTGVGYKADFTREAGSPQDAPFAVSYPFFNRMVETIQLPPGFSKASIPANAEVNQVVAGVEYRRSATLDDSLFRIEATERSIAAEFPAREAAAAQAALRKLAGQTVYLGEPASYRPTDREIAEQEKATPTSADGYIERGNLYLDRDRLDDAIADFDRAIQLEPKNGWGFANRGLARVWKGDYDAAKRDLDTADALEPRIIVAARARGLMAARQGDFAAAVAAFTKALDIEPDDRFSLGRRAIANRVAGNEDAALRDAAAALKIDPDWTELYLLRANILRNQGKRDAAFKEAAALEAVPHQTSLGYIAAANLYAALDKMEDAMRAYDRALAIKPEGIVYLNRGLNRPRSDVAGRRADFDKALSLDPELIEARDAKADLLSDAGDIPGAIALYSAGLQKAPDNRLFLMRRGILYARSGDGKRAQQDLARARAQMSAAVELNNLCWAKATAGVELESALADCDAALAKQPDTPAYRDSRALVLLRLGRIDDAIAEYDRALAKQPTMAASLFGRAVAWARKGDKAKSDLDRAAAVKADADVEAEFERYGVRL